MAFSVKRSSYAWCWNTSPPRNYGMHSPGLATEGNLRPHPYLISCNLQPNDPSTFFWNKDGWAWVITRSVLHNSFLYEIVNIKSSSSQKWPHWDVIWKICHTLAFAFLQFSQNKVRNSWAKPETMIAHIHHLWLQTQETENQVETELKNSMSLGDDKNSHH